MNSAFDWNEALLNERDQLRTQNQHLWTTIKALRTEMVEMTSELTLLRGKQPSCDAFCDTASLLAASDKSTCTDTGDDVDNIKHQSIASPLKSLDRQLSNIIVFGDAAVSLNVDADDTKRSTSQSSLNRNSNRQSAKTRSMNRRSKRNTAKSPTVGNQMLDFKPTISTDFDHQLPSPPRESLNRNIMPQQESQQQVQQQEQEEEYQQHNISDVESRMATLENSISIQVAAIKNLVRLDQNCKEYCAYLLSVQGPEGELWKIEKQHSDFTNLHTTLKQSSGKSRLSRQPSKQTFSAASTLSPFKTDRLRVELNEYLASIVREAQNSNDRGRHEVLRFLSTDVSTNNNSTITPTTQDAAEIADARVFSDTLKEGYLTKKGKSFGWKRRYFALRQDRLDYYESKQLAFKVSQSDQVPSGRGCGTIYLRGSQVSRQRKADTSRIESNQLRHALMVTEAPTKNGEVKQSILCAQNDAERDEWVMLLTDQVRNLTRQDEEATQQQLMERQRSQADGSRRAQELADNLSQTLLKRADDGSMQRIQPSNPAVDVAKPERKSRALVDWAAPNPRASTMQSSRVFGVPLEQAIQYSSSKANFPLPSIVYRCIEFLDSQKAYLEEGIYRLSGSNANINTLRNRFEQEADINLLAEYNALSDSRLIDVNTVASLLKMYLRELPESLLTTEMHSQFVGVLDQVDRRDRVRELARLVEMLPAANRMLLETLLSHLITIIRHSESNKMNLSNVVIVFSPTIGIPSEIFMLMLMEFDSIFNAIPVVEDNAPQGREYPEPLIVAEQSPPQLPQKDNRKSVIVHHHDGQLLEDERLNSLAEYDNETDDEEEAYCDSILSNRRVITRKLSHESDDDSITSFPATPTNVASRPTSAVYGRMMDQFKNNEGLTIQNIVDEVESIDPEVENSPNNFRMSKFYASYE